MEKTYKLAIIDKDNAVIGFSNIADWVKYPTSQGYNFIELCPGHLFVKVDNFWVYRP
jgi:hypothetical protein